MGPQGSVFEGKTLDEAVRKGLDALGLSRAEVMITMLEEGSGGFLGLGARPYKVRIMPRPGGAPREPEAEREHTRSRSGRDRGGRDRGGRDRGRGRGRDGGSRDGGGSREPRREAPAEERRAAPVGERREGRGEERRDGRREGGAERRDANRQGGRPGGREERRERREERPAMAAAAPPRATPAPESVTAGGEGDEGRRRRRRGRRGGRGRGEREAPMTEGAPAMDTSAVATMMPAPESAPLAPREPHMEPVASVERRPEPRRESESRRESEPRREPESAGGLDAEQLAAEGKRWTEQLLGAMGFEARVSARAEGDRVDVTAEVSSDEELLTGPKGEVRQALQHLLNRMVNRGEGSRYHLQLEINDFWQHRERELEALARSMAEEAVKRDGEVVSEYLNAQERRIIHVTLREDARVKTYALGTGMIKRLAVAPAGFEGGERSED